MVRTSNGYMVSRKEMIKEHKRIIPKLKKAGEKKEVEDQEEELEEIKEKGKKKNEKEEEED